MATDFNNELDTELTSETKLTIASGKIANFAYDSDAYDNDTVAGVEEYDYDNHQNIPLGDATILNTDSSILNKGVRSQASSLTRMMLNHFLGRSSFNVNKLADHLKNLLTTLKTFIQEGSNEWSPTILYKAGDVVYFMTTLNYEPCKRTFKCIVNCPSVNLPPVYTDGSLINTTYWKELSGRVAGLTVGATNSGKTNVAMFNGSITVNGDITQSGTPYETHAEQIYTKKDNIITREDATGALPSGDYSGIKVNNYDGNGANGILAYRSDGTAVVGDEAGSPAVENLQPLLTRDEANNITNGAPLVWDATNKRAIGGSTSGVSVITTATTTVNNIPLSNNDAIQLLFTADISDTNATGGVTPLDITYNNVSVPLKVSKNGVLTDIFAHEVLTNIWKYLQAYTVLDLIYQSDYDGNGNPAFIVKGNPILLSSSDYTIYADGKMGGCPPVNATYTQYPQCKSPQEIWFTTTWVELNFSGAFFRASGGNADDFIDESGVLVAQDQMLQSHKHNDSGHSHSVSMWKIGSSSNWHDTYHAWSDSSAHGRSGSVDTSSGYANLGNAVAYGDSGTVSTGPENRPKNFTIRVWRRVS